MHKPSTFPVNCIRNADGSLPDSPVEALNTLARHFAEVCTLPELKRPSKDQEKCRAEVDEGITRALESKSPMDVEFSLQEVKEAIAKFKSTESAAGPDAIPTKFLKKSPERVLEVLLFISQL